MTIKMTADTNAEAGLPIDPEGDQEADPGPDIKEVTPGTEGAQEVLSLHILLEGIAQAGSPGHDIVAILEAIMIPDLQTASV